MTIKITWKGILGALASGISGWLIRHLLDHFDLFAKLTAAAQSPEAGKLFRGVFSPRYSLFDLFLILLFALLIYLLITWLRRRFFGADLKLSKAKAEIEAFDRGVFNKAVLFKWDVVFNAYDRPEATNVRPFCNKHEPPVPMPYDQPLEMYRCQQCANKVSKPYIEAMGTYNNEYSAYRSQIQAELENRWEKLIAKK